MVNVWRYIFIIFLTFDNDAHGEVSKNEIIVKCIHGCTVDDKTIKCEDGGNLELHYSFEMKGFSRIDLKYNNVDVLYAYKDKTVVQQKSRDKRFELPDKLSSRTDRFILQFNLTNVSILNDNGKSIDFELDFRSIGYVTDSHVVKVFISPTVVTFPNEEYNVREYGRQVINFELHGYPPPNVTAMFAGKPINVRRNTTITRLKYQYEAILGTVMRDECGKELKFIATGYKTITFSTQIRVSFTPNAVKHVYAYSHRNNSVMVSWSEIESGNCGAMYEVHYLQNVHSSAMTWFNCSTMKVNSISIRAVVNGILGPLSAPVTPLGKPAPVTPAPMTTITGEGISSPPLLTSPHFTRKTVTERPHSTGIGKKAAIGKDQGTKQKFYLICVIGGLCLVILILILIVIRGRKSLRCSQYKVKEVSLQQLISSNSPSVDQESLQTENEELRATLQRYEKENNELGAKLRRYEEGVKESGHGAIKSPNIDPTYAEIAGLDASSTKGENEVTPYKAITSRTVDAKYAAPESGPYNKKSKNTITPYKAITSRTVDAKYAAPESGSNNKKSKNTIMPYKTIASPNVDSTYVAAETDTGPNYTQIDNPTDQYRSIDQRNVPTEYAALESRPPDYEEIPETSPKPIPKPPEYDPVVL